MVLVLNLMYDVRGKELTLLLCMHVHTRYVIKQWRWCYVIVLLYYDYQDAMKLIIYKYTYLSTSFIS